MVQPYIAWGFLIYWGITSNSLVSGETKWIWEAWSLIPAQATNQSYRWPDWDLIMSMAFTSLLAFTSGDEKKLLLCRACVVLPCWSGVCQEEHMKPAQCVEQRVPRGTHETSSMRWAEGAKRNTWNQLNALSRWCQEEHMKPVQCVELKVPRGTHETSSMRWTEGAKRNTWTSSMRCTEGAKRNEWNQLNELSRGCQEELMLFCFCCCCCCWSQTVEFFTLVQSMPGGWKCCLLQLV